MWQRRAKHCPLCGAGLGRTEVEGRERPTCAQCAFVLYENPACAAAGIVLDDERRVLLIQRAIEPFKGHWALPAGYQEINEDPSQTAVREIFEESGIEVEVVELFDLLVIPEDARKPANLAVFLCRQIGGTLKPGNDAIDAAWFDLERLPEKLGFDNRRRILDRLPRR